MHFRRSGLVFSLVLVASPLVACGGSAPASPPATPAAPAPAESPAQADAKGEHVDGTAAKKLVAEGAKLVDVRTPAEYAEKHIDGAENVPVDTVGEHDFGPKDAPVVVYCHSGKRAARAAETLRRAGYTRVYELGGMSNWDK